MNHQLNPPELELPETFLDTDFPQVSLEPKESTLKICSSKLSKDYLEILKENTTPY